MQSSKPVVINNAGLDIVLEAEAGEVGFPFCNSYSCPWICHDL